MQDFFGTTPSTMDRFISIGSIVRNFIGMGDVCTLTIGAIVYQMKYFVVIVILPVGKILYQMFNKYFF
jgi:hypothetical protein